ncbi:MAG: hypothetical protein JWL60_2576, partial [Gemmatimonadetes bacterium]|nr:hypothetical protein [Gemmatimonadota bacterium]
MEPSETTPAAESASGTVPPVPATPEGTPPFADPGSPAAAAAAAPVAEQPA